jgi:hypothetical protein
MTKFEYDELGEEYSIWENRNTTVSNLYNTLKDLANLNYKDSLTDFLNENSLTKDYHHESHRNKSSYRNVVRLFVKDFETFKFNIYGIDNWIWNQLGVTLTDVFTKKDLPIFLKKLKQLKKVVYKELQKVEKEYFSVNVNELELDPKSDLKNLLNSYCDPCTRVRILKFLEKQGVEL